MRPVQLTLIQSTVIMPIRTVTVVLFSECRVFQQITLNSLRKHPIWVEMQTMDAENARRVEIMR